METITGFAELDSVGGFFNFQNNAALTAVPVFDALTTAGGIGISINTALTALPTFSKITSIVNFNILSNPELTAISGFNALTSITNDLIITDNAKLETIAGFDVLESVGRNFTISANPTLSSCCAFSPIANDDLTIGGTTTISRNKAGCSSKTEITNDCPRDITIAENSDVPGDVATLVRLKGDLTIGGAITTFPNFAALEVVEGESRPLTASLRLP